MVKIYKFFIFDNIIKKFIIIYKIETINNKEIPIYISDYVMMGYGTGAIMAVPAHDQRDYEFAKKFKLF